MKMKFYLIQFLVFFGILYSTAHAATPEIIVFNNQKYELLSQENIKNMNKKIYLLMSPKNSSSPSSSLKVIKMYFPMEEGTEVFNHFFEEMKKSKDTIILKLSNHEFMFSNSEMMILEGKKHEILDITYVTWIKEDKRLYQIAFQEVYDPEAMIALLSKSKRQEILEANIQKIITELPKFAQK